MKTVPTGNTFIGTVTTTGLNPASVMAAGTPADCVPTKEGTVASAVLPRDTSSPTVEPLAIFRPGGGIW
jgi:hypothetical protein